MRLPNFKGVALRARSAAPKALPVVAGAVVGAAIVVAPSLVLAAASTPAAVGPTDLGTALNSIQSLLYSVALPTAGVGFATGGVWHAVAHDPRSQEGAKGLMKGAVIGAVATILASAVLGGVSGALGG